MKIAVQDSNLIGQRSYVCKCWLWIQNAIKAEKSSLYKADLNIVLHCIQIFLNTYLSRHAGKVSHKEDFMIESIYHYRQTSNKL